MERLYAVPSEKLRVWSIWLTKIGEIADEWQRWLRAHIDLAIRLAEQLQAVEGRVEQTEETDEQSTVATDEEKITSEAEDVDQGSFARGSTVVADILKARSEIYTSTMTVVTEDMKEGTTSEKALDEEGPPLIWPIGIPWIHLGMEGEDDTQPFERLPLPRDEEEMRQFAKKFTHEATVYRSYYKNWKETAEQATREIGCRAVIATYLAQGKNRFGKIKAPPRPKLATGKKLSKARPKKPYGKSRAKSVGKSSKRASSSSEEEKFFTPPESISEVTNGDEPMESPSKMDTIEEEPDESVVKDPETAEKDRKETASGRSSKVASKTGSGTTSKTSKVQVVKVDDLVRDCARAVEPVPYIFYLKVEPDIDIAIEHDDDEVIAADTDRESIVGAYRRLFFNLTDKPCKGGKPWML
ncbi:hypothetical protein WN48_01132 [Eufriesea mexicana]|nr:hypothetical protein WN48_01132 [Eufriesea mexicana]